MNFSNRLHSDGKGLTDTRHILLETDADYALTKGRDHWKSNVIYTSSPWLIEKLESQRRPVVPIERFITQDEMRQIGRFSRKISKAIADSMDRSQWDIPHHVAMGYALHVSIRKTLFVLLYKLHLLYRFLSLVEEAGEEGVIVGAGRLSPVKGFYADVGRFDTVFSALASEMTLPSTISCVQTKQAEYSGKMKKLQRLGQSRLERLLFLPNLNKNLVLLKLWKVAAKYREVTVPFRKNSVCIFYYKGCELIDEIVAPLFFYAGRLKRLKLESGGVNSHGLEAPHLSSNQVLGAMKEVADQCLPPTLKTPEALHITSRILAERVSDALHYGTQWAHGFSRLDEKYFHGKTQMPCAVISNTLSSPLDRALFCYLRERHVPVFVGEHGVTHGLSEISEDAVRSQSSMLVSDFGIFFNETSFNIHKQNGNLKQGIVAGAPVLNKNMKFKKIQRLICKKAMGIPAHKRVVVYVANLYTNNQIYSPGISNDYEYHQFKKKVVYDLLGKLNEPCILKLYPTHRYLEDDPFLDLLPLPDNVIPIQYFEFRYLRAVCDVVLCDSPQSTLGWAWSTGVPLVFFDLPANPLLPHIAERFDRAIFRMDCSENGWLEKTSEILGLSQEDLLRKWKEKAASRRAVERDALFGPPGSPGGRAARFIVQNARSRFAGRSPVC